MHCEALVGFGLQVESLSVDGVLELEAEGMKQKPRMSLSSEERVANDGQPTVGQMCSDLVFAPGLRLGREQTVPASALQKLKLRAGRLPGAYRDPSGPVPQRRLLDPVGIKSFALDPAQIFLFHLTRLELLSNGNSDLARGAEKDQT